jgi:hypothetical protein
MAAQPIMDETEYEKGYDPINQEEINVSDWLNQDLNNNLVIRYNNTNYLLSTETLEKQLENQRAKQMKCSTTHGAVRLPSNTEPVRYMDLVLVGIPGVAVERKDIEDIIRNITKSSRLYVIVPVSSGIAANSLYGFIQSNEPDSITIAPQSIEDNLSTDNSKCKTNGILFNRKIVELNKVSGGKIHRNKSKRNTKKKRRKNITRKNRKNKSKKM